MTAPNQLDKLCSEAFMAMKYQNATADDCFVLACAELDTKEREIVSAYLEKVATGQVSKAAALTVVEAWAERLGFSIDGDKLSWLLSARKCLSAAS